MSPVPHSATHRESATDLPSSPTATDGWQRFALLALPATTLSVLSISALGVTPLLLFANDDLRVLFRLPAAALWAALGAALAWAIVIGCRHRPGRSFPRYWALLLATVNGGLFLLSVLVHLVVLPAPLGPWLDGFVVAGLASAVVLSLRLLRLRPDQPLLAWVGALGLFVALALVLLPTLALGRSALASQTAATDEHIARLRDAAERMRRVASFDWEVLAADPQAVERQVEELRQLSLAERLPGPEHYRLAKALGREAEMDAAAAELATSFDGLLAGPQLASVVEPPVRWDRGHEEWRANPDFPRLSELVGDYHLQVGRLFRQLSTSDGGNAWQTALAHTEAEATEWRRAAAESWSRDWLHHRFEGVDSAPAPEISTLLLKPLTQGSEPELTPADFAALLSLPADRLEELARRAPACYARAYREDGWVYRRLDCYAFRAAADTPGAELWFELRLVWRSTDGRFAGAERRMKEVYLIFPVPDGESSESYPEKVMQETFQAVARIQGMTITTMDRSGSPLAGFELTGRGNGVEVRPPVVESYLADQRAVMVRALPR